MYTPPVARRVVARWKLPVSGLYCRMYSTGAFYASPQRTTTASSDEPGKPTFRLTNARGLYATGHLQKLMSLYEEVTARVGTPQKLETEFNEEVSGTQLRRIIDAEGYEPEVKLLAMSIFLGEAKHEHADDMLELAQNSYALGMAAGADLQTMLSAKPQLHFMNGSTPAAQGQRAMLRASVHLLSFLSADEARDLTLEQWMELERPLALKLQGRTPYLRKMNLNKATLRLTQDTLRRLLVLNVPPHEVIERWVGDRLTSGLTLLGEESGRFSHPWAQVTAYLTREELAELQEYFSTHGVDPHRLLSGQETAFALSYVWVKRGPAGMADYVSWASGASSLGYLRFTGKEKAATVQKIVDAVDSSEDVALHWLLLMS